LPLGILYVNPKRVPFEDQCPAHEQGKIPLFKRKHDVHKLEALLATFQ
jgi:hypothetical protein